MIPEPSKLRSFARVVAAALTAFCVVLAGFLAIRYQVNQEEREYSEFAARSAVRDIEQHLKEADSTAKQAEAFLAFPCTQDVRSKLNRLIISNSHLRVVSLIQNNQLLCSSFGTSVPRTVDLSDYIDNRLSLKRGSVITPNSPLLILLSTFPEGAVAISLRASQLAETLSFPGNRFVLRLRVGEQLLTSQNQLIHAPLQKGTRVKFSQAYPFSVEYDEPPILPVSQVILKGRVPVTLFILFGLLSGVLTWCFCFRKTTPYDHLLLAIKRKEIIPWYQPVVNAQTGDISGVEVLARWRHSSGVFVPPDVFIPQAEKSGLIIPMTRLLIKHVAADLVPVVHRLRQPFHIAFNISAAHISAGNQTASDFRELQRSFPEGSVQLIAEITEREPFEQSAGLIELLQNLRLMGVQVALDDFGTGYSNLGYLNTMPIDYIKIDRSFINYLNEEAGSDRLVSCVISMAETLGLGIVAEGVETKYQATWLAAHHVTFLQGYYYSRPLPAAALVRMIVLQGKHF
jgi:sensor c-di-GMP phosphodiesterase-like protein